LDPDIVLLPGDIVDEDLNPVIKENLGESLRTIKSKFGVFAVTGNHEYIGGVEEAVSYLTENGVHFLRDESILINHTAYLLGREDRSVNRFKNKSRKTLQEIMQGVDKHYPIISMDHQPFHLAEAEENGIDLQLSGHTHNGQLWPLNYITDAIYEVDWGYKRIADTHIYVSCGVGTWGPPVRSGNRPEIVNIKLDFE
jgi:predicted MPP superfamily phosphohydrolase